MSSDARWDRLFQDLEHRVAGDPELPDLVEAERVSVNLIDRLRSGVLQPIVVRAAGEDIAGTLCDVGENWVRIRRPDSDVALPVSSIARVSDLGARSPARGIQMTWNALLRRLARHGAWIVCALPGEMLSGRVIAVAADHIEVRSEAGARVILPTAAIRYVRATAAAFDDIV